MLRLPCSECQTIPSNSKILKCYGSRHVPHGLRSDEATLCRQEVGSKVRFSRTFGSGCVFSLFSNFPENTMVPSANSSALTVIDCVQTQCRDEVCCSFTRYHKESKQNSRWFLPSHLQLATGGKNWHPVRNGLAPHRTSIWSPPISYPTIQETSDPLILALHYTHPFRITVSPTLLSTSPSHPPIPNSLPPNLLTSKLDMVYRSNKLPKMPPRYTISPPARNSLMTTPPPPS